MNLEQISVRVMKAWRWLPIKWKKYISLVLVIGIYLSMSSYTFFKR